MDANSVCFVVVVVAGSGDGGVCVCVCKGERDGSVGKGACCQVFGLEFDP